MSSRLPALRAAAVTITALAWAAACGSADSVSTNVENRCVIYYGDDVVPAPPDGAALCPKGACNFQSQSGCSASQNCFPHYDAASNSVVPTCGTAGGQKKGEPCVTAQQICGRGMVCADGVCAKVCCGGDYSACDPGESCFRHATTFMIPSTAGAQGGMLIDYDEGLGTCAPVGTCDVLDKNSCASDTKHPVCRVVDPTGAVACQQASDRKLGDECDDVHRCGGGEHCVSQLSAEASTPRHCVRLCRFGSCTAEPGCPRGEGPCVHFNRDPEGVGECTPGWKREGVEVDAGTSGNGPDASK
jgi:hypothetical protein